MRAHSSAPSEVYTALPRARDGVRHFRAGVRTGGPGDAGIDGVIEEDRLGLDVISIQA